MASIVGTPPPGVGPPVPGESNKVVVKVAPAPGVVPGPGPAGGVEAEKAKCAAFAGTFVLKGVGGPKRHKFTVEVKSAGLKQVTFFLDTRKIKTFAPSGSSHPKFFKVKIYPGKLGKGPHHVSAVGVLVDTSVRPRESQRRVRPPGHRRPPPELHRLIILGPSLARLGRERRSRRAAPARAAHTDRLDRGPWRRGAPRAARGPRAQTISIGVPTSTIRHRRLMSPLRMRMQPWEGRPGTSCGSSVPWMPTTPPPGHSLRAGA